jgi:RNA polymerase sigma-70 factor (ECF subfamily)
MWDSDASFTTTHWSLVLQLGEQDPDQSEAALAELCRRYWYPLYTFVRRSVGDAHEAQDLTQSFFALLLEKGLLSRATPERGRFRNFLLASIKNFMSNEKDRAKAHKRGGEITKLSLDLVMGEVRLNREPTHNLSPERVFERQWALTLLDLVIVRLQPGFLRFLKGL